MVTDGYPKPCHCEAQRAVAISSSAVTHCIRPINIENLKCTMLIGATCIGTPVLEIATSRESMYDCPRQS